MSDKRIRILVLCTGNSCRSQMAEGFFRHYGQEKIDLFSAGTEPKGVNPTAVRVMNEVGIDISGHTTNHVREYVDQTFDYIITVCDNAARNCPRFAGEGTRLHWPFDDPAEATGTEADVLRQFRQVRDEIEEQVRDWLTTHTHAVT